MTQDMKTKIITYSVIGDDGSTETRLVTVVLPEPTMHVRGLLRSCVEEWTRTGVELDTKFNELKLQLPTDGYEIDRSRRAQQLELQRLYATSDYVHEMNVAILRAIAVRAAMTAEDVELFENADNDKWISIKDVADAVNSFRQILGT
ncbi:MAG TPA: hypothetical protein PLW14_09035 [Chlorobiota bacterium]|nr:hypothetical protein [Chlorobiota bacterium]